MSKMQSISFLLGSAAVLLLTSTAQADGGKSHSSLTFVAVATGAQEVPAVDTGAIGKVVVRFDLGFTKAHVRMHLKGINTMVVAAHLHCNRAGLNGPPAFGLMGPGPLMEIGERAQVTLTNADAVADCTGVIGRPVGNIAGLYDAMRDGLIYVNFHTPDFPPGEVRGQLLPLKD